MAPIARTRSLILEELEFRHLEPLHNVAMAPNVRRHWRSRGRLIPPHHWQSYLAEAVFSAVAVDRATHEVVGYAELVDHHERDLVSYCNLLVRDDLRRSGAAFELGAAFLDDVFTRFNLRKIYLLVDGSNIASVDGLRRIFAVEGVLREFALIDGKFEDVHIIAITRDDLRGFLARPHITKWLRHSTALRGIR
jgi:RimJ/RimL family protein N-acetyltransferase